MKTTNNTFYKVLWVDDEESIVAHTKLAAEDYNLDLVHFTNWEEAQDDLEHNFDEYSAIILDAFCKNKTGQLENESFIITALKRMSEIVGRKQQDIPWYILSAGTMESFHTIIKGALESREGKDVEWGDMLYIKDTTEKEKSSSKLFENIQRVASQRGLNIVLHRYDKVFSYMGEDQLIRSEARKYMVKMLSVLYYPEENIGFLYETNPIRKVVEYLFDAALTVGLLPNNCINERGGIILRDASLYMAGKNINHSGVRYGEPGSKKDGGGGEAIFTPEIADMVRNLINVGGEGSHVIKKTHEKKYAVNEENKELFFACVLQLCHVIKWFGEYAGAHPNKDENLSKKRTIEISDKPSDKNPKPSATLVAEVTDLTDNLSDTEKPAFDDDQIEKIVIIPSSSTNGDAVREMLEELLPEELHSKIMMTVKCDSI